MTIESVSDTTDPTTHKFVQKIRFSTQTPSDNEGNIYISIPAIYGDPVNVFVSRERTSDIDFGYIQKENITMKLAIPSEYMVDSLARPVKLAMPDTSIEFNYQTEKADNSVTLRQNLEYARSFYKKDVYPGFYDFQQKYYDLKQRPIILKKKS